MPQVTYDSQVIASLKLKPVRKPIASAELAQYLPYWQTNSRNYYGIINFAFSMYPHILRPEFGCPGWLFKMLPKILRYEQGWDKLRRNYGICTYREGAKTTWSLAIAAYFILVGQYGIYWEDNLLPEADYIRIIGQSVTKATERVMSLSDLIRSPTIDGLFGALSPTMKDVKDDKLSNSVKLLILKNGYVVQPAGLDQPVRGALIKFKRPKFDIYDDVEDRKNTATEQLRKRNADRILSEIYGGLDKEDGMSLYLGNFVHSDCYMKHILEDNSYKTIRCGITNVDENGIETADWPERYSLDYVARLKQYYENKSELGGVKTFMLEYYNEIISSKEFSLPSFKGSYVWEYGRSWVRFVEGSYEKVLPCYIGIGVDPAISDKSGSSDSAIAVVAYCSDGKRRIIDLKIGKLDIRDRFKSGAESIILATKPEELRMVTRVGTVSEALRLAHKYHANWISVENSGQQLAWYNDFKEIYEKTKHALNYADGMKIVPFKPPDEKVYKLDTGLMSRIDAGQYYIIENHPLERFLKAQISGFPTSKLDILDAIYNAEVLSRTPAHLEFGVNSLLNNKSSEYGMYGRFHPDVEPWMVV